MIDYGLKNRVAIITGANNPWGIGAATALAFAREGAKVVLVYKKLPRAFDENKTDRNGVDRYFEANAGNADIVESRLKAMKADYLVLESDMKVGDICDICGFNTLSFFIKQYKKKFGFTPLEHRKR